MKGKDPWQGKDSWQGKDFWQGKDSSLGMDPWQGKDFWLGKDPMLDCWVLIAGRPVLPGLVGLRGQGGLSGPHTFP